MRAPTPDNGNTFEAATKVTYAVVSHADGQRHTSLHGIGVKWQFNLSRAPWWGGALKDH